MRLSSTTIWPGRRLGSSTRSTKLSKTCPRPRHRPAGSRPCPSRVRVASQAICLSPTARSRAPQLAAHAGHALAAASASIGVLVSSSKISRGRVDRGHSPEDHQRDDEESHGGAHGDAQMRPPDRSLETGSLPLGRAGTSRARFEQTTPFGIGANRDGEGEGGRELRYAADRARGLMGIAQDRRWSGRIDWVPDEPQTGNAGNVPARGRLAIATRT